ncbi:MAG: hypothetical protein U0936_01665 [Planctomycetaceae bacterium]
MQKSFNRTHTARSYAKILAKDSPLLEKQKILQHCRMLFDVAALHMTVVEYPIPELVKTDDSGQVVGHGRTSRRSIYLKELGSMLTSLERDSWQVYGGLGTMTIDDKNETVSICRIKLVHVKVAALLAEMETEVTKRKNQLVVRKYKVADLVVRGSMGLNTLEASTSLSNNVDEGVSKQVRGRSLNTPLARES